MYLCYTRSRGVTLDTACPSRSEGLQGFDTEGWAGVMLCFVSGAQVSEFGHLSSRPLCTHRHCENASVVEPWTRRAHPGVKAFKALDT